MNREWALAWDQVTQYAEEHGGELQRDGHRFSYTWGDDTYIWAEDNAPRFALRMGDISMRLWTLEALDKVYTALSQGRGFTPNEARLVLDVLGNGMDGREWVDAESEQTYDSAVEKLRAMANG